jgi:XTP/dITP diphosphohydrolase
MKIEKIRLATSNAGKLREYERLAPGSALALDLLPGFSQLPLFDETAPTFAENAAGKALHYSRFTDEIVLADDSGLSVRGLNGAPGVHSARYAGPDATDGDRNRKLLAELNGKTGADREARFICVTVLARHGNAIAVVSDFVEGTITTEIRGADGFGYDPVFYLPELGRTFGEATTEEKDRLSHRGKAFRKLLAWIAGEAVSS